MSKTVLVTWVLLLPLSFACRSDRDDEPGDPVARLMSVRYLKAADELDSHRVVSTLKVEAEGPEETTAKSLRETLEVDDETNYRIVRRRHDGDAPWELVNVGSSYYVIDPEGNVETLQPGMLGQWTRERVAESWRSVLSDFQEAITLTEAGSEELQGRPTTLYRLTSKEDDRPGDTGIRLQGLSGTIQVDQQTGFPLRVELTGAYVSQRQERGDVKVHIRSFEHSLGDFGQVEPIEPPELESDE